jgi:hypothetical protein
MRFPFRASALAAALAAIAMCDDPRARAEDGPRVPLSDGLVPQTELDAVSLSMVDEKLVLSLAVETHVQIEITEFALAGIQHAGLKQFTEKKLATYRRLYTTLDELSGGRATSTLARYVRPAATANSPAPGLAVKPAETVVTVAPIKPATADDEAPAKPRRKKMGVGDIVQNATTNAILRLRLEIAEQYGDLLRAELSEAGSENFDRRYLAVELYNQMQVLAMLRVFEHQASQDLARIIRVATTAAESNLLEGRQVSDLMRVSPPAPSDATVPLVDAAPGGM